MRTFKKDNLVVEIYENRTLMGEGAAKAIKEKIAQMLKEKEELNIIFAAAPSQNDVLKALVEDKEIEWNRVNAYHMDEYIGLDKDAPQGFGCFLKTHIFGLVPFKSVNYIDVTATDPEAEAQRYGKLLEENPTDIVVMGIGENGHIAFNDPPVADFNDPKWVKVVELDPVCRNQQVNDGCFKSIDEVPTHALTLTCPTLTRAPYMFCIVPAPTKANAVKEMLTTDKIDEHCPAAILRLHDCATLYCDADSASLLA
jgi:glucosamine-6-phosphate deaminase